MSSINTESVHIIPLGYEYDRAVRVFDKKKAERVYLITQKESDTYEADRNYAPRVAAALRKKEMQVEIITINTFDLWELLKTLSYLIRTEKQKGNEVLVNMSASGKLGAAAAAMAGMAQGAEVYYVPADRYSSEEERDIHGLSVCTSPTFVSLPNVSISLPDDNEVDVLNYLYQEHEKRSAGEIIKGKYGCSAVKKGAYADDDRQYELQRKAQSKDLMNLTNLMKRMEEKGYIGKEKKGRQMFYSIKDSGIDALILSGKLRPDDFPVE